jgi:hypothetical protein
MKTTRPIKELSPEQRKRNKGSMNKDWDQKTASIKDWIREARRGIDEGDVNVAVLALCDGLRNTVLLLSEQEQAIDVLWRRFITMPVEDLNKMMAKETNDDENCNGD